MVLQTKKAPLKQKRRLTRQHERDRIGGMALKQKQQRFVNELLSDPERNAVKACYAAGYKCKNANVANATASRLLSNVNVQEAIKIADADREKRLSITKDYVLRRLRENLERAMQAEPVLDKEGNPTGQYRYEGAVANRAAELLGKHLGLFPDRHEHTGKGGGAMEMDVKTTTTEPENFLARIAGYKSAYERLGLIPASGNGESVDTGTGREGGTTEASPETNGVHAKPGT